MAQVQTSQSVSICVRYSIFGIVKILMCQVLNRRFGNIKVAVCDLHRFKTCHDNTQYSCCSC